jgi:hypothetical protein
MFNTIVEVGAVGTGSVSCHGSEQKMRLRLRNTAKGDLDPTKNVLVYFFMNYFYFSKYISDLADFENLVD